MFPVLRVTLLDNQLLPLYCYYQGDTGAPGRRMSNMRDGVWRLAMADGTFAGQHVTCLRGDRDGHRKSHGPLGSFWLGARVFLYDRGRATLRETAVSAQSGRDYLALKGALFF